MFTIHATINEIDDRFGWNMLHVRNAKRKLQKRKINTLVENANSHPSTQQQGLIFVYNELFFIT